MEMVYTGPQTVTHPSTNLVEDGQELNLQLNDLQIRCPNHYTTKPPNTT